MRKILIPALPLFLMAASLSGQNPICPEGIYIADPTARVAPDGRLYVYGSLDIRPGKSCSDRYHVLSTGDLREWTLKRESFRYEKTLYAPDVMYRDGTYYLYFDTPDGSEFVAHSTSPEGPFHGAERIEGPRQIDPNIFVDDDGQAYYFWGQFSAKGARMNPDMKTLDLSTLVDGIVTEKDHHFHEGSYVIKRNGYYYFIFADISRRGRPTCLGYAMSSSPLGPYTYKGVIIDNYGCDPSSWNNHGSLVCFGDQWYVFYHRSTHGCKSMRKACVEPIVFLEDGTIPEVEMTSQGAGGPLSAFLPVPAGRACGLRGHIRIREEEGAEVLGGIRDGDTAVWKYLDFSRRGARRILLDIIPGGSGNSGGWIEVRSDSADGRLLGRIAVPAGEGRQTVSSRIRKVRGVHALHLTFRSAGEDVPPGDLPFTLRSVRFR